MKKIIIILLALLSFASYGQAEFEKVAIKENVETASTTKIVSQQPGTGELNYINATALPISTATQNKLDLKLNISDLPTNLTLYPTTAVSDVSGYVKMVADIHDADYNTVAVDVSTPTITGTAQLVSQRISSAGVLIGQPGVFNITTFGNIRRLSGTGTAEFFFKVYHRDSAGTETLICTSSTSAIVTNGTYAEFTASGLWDDGDFIATDRIVIKTYANRIAGGSDPVYQFQFGGSQPVRTLLPVPFSVVDAGYEMKNNKSDSYTASSSTTYASTKALVDGLGSKIGGSGTTGYLPKFTNSNILDDSLMHDDGDKITISAPTFDSTQIIADLGSAGEQGYTFDGTHHYIVGTNSLAKFDSGWNQILINTNAMSGISGVNHLGDMVYLDGYLYVPTETYPAVTGMKIAKYDASTLALVTTYDISAQNHEVSSITTDGTDLYISSYIDGTKIWKYSLTGTYLGFISITTPFTNNIQGISYYDGNFYVVEQTKISKLSLDGVDNLYLLPVPGNVANTHRGEGLQVVDGQIRMVVLDVTPQVWYIDRGSAGAKKIKLDNTGLGSFKKVRIGTDADIQDFPLQNSGGAVFSNIATTTDYSRVPLYSHVIGNRGGGNVPMFATKTDKTTSTGMFFIALQNSDVARTSESDIIFRTANSVGSPLTSSGLAYSIENGTTRLMWIDRSGNATFSNASNEIDLELRGGSYYYRTFVKYSGNEFGIYDVTNSRTFFRHTSSPTVASPKLALLDSGVGNVLIRTNIDNGVDGLQINGSQLSTGQIKSTLATGTSPLSVASTTVNSNLNADLLDGQHGSYFAPIASPALTGTPTAPTATAGTNTTQIATTAFVLANSGTGGKYTPTAVAGSNVTSVAITAAHTYTRVGNIVTVYGIATSTTTSSSVASTYTITLPISRATSTAIVVGSGRTIDTGTSELAPVVINSLSTTTATIGFTSTSTGSIVCRYSFQYDVTD